MLPNNSALGFPTYFRVMSHFGRFRVSGSDAATLLHHLTTNHIKKLQSGQGCEAILISNKAHVLDWLTIWREGAEYSVLTSPNRRAMFASHAQKFVLYKQEVKFEDETESGALFGLFGENARGVLANWNAEEILDAPLNSVLKLEVQGIEIKLLRTRRLPGNGVLVQSDNREGLQKLTADSEVPLCDDATYNAIRIEAGIPVAGLELTEDINPWEANLDFAISLDKGCYNGQEIVARLNTYQKIKQRLMGLHLESALENGPRVALKSESRDAGVLTSSAVSPKFGAIGLGFIRTDFQDAGRNLEAQSTPPQAVRVANLPFE